jgi:hypothetical protein
MISISSIRSAWPPTLPDDALPKVNSIIKRASIRFAHFKDTPSATKLMSGLHTGVAHQVVGASETRHVESTSFFA